MHWLRHLKEHHKKFREHRDWLLGVEQNAITGSYIFLVFLIFYSMGGHRVVPSADEHFYCATKYAVTALTEGIRQELREANTHIRATVS